MNNLKKLRQEKKLTQNDIASALNIARTTYVGYELEKRDIPTDVLISLSNYYDVSIDYLLCRENVVNVEKENNSIPEYFETPQDAIKFILEQPMIANFGGYDLELMEDDEIMDMAEDVADMLRIMAKKHKK